MQQYQVKYWDLLPLLLSLMTGEGEMLLVWWPAVEAVVAAVVVAVVRYYLLRLLHHRVVRLINQSRHLHHGEEGCWCRLAMMIAEVEKSVLNLDARLGMG